MAKKMAKHIRFSHAWPFSKLGFLTDVAYHYLELVLANNLSKMKQAWGENFRGHPHRPKKISARSHLTSPQSDGKKVKKSA